MVDFQSRDTRRGADDEDGEDDAAAETESNDDAEASQTKTAESAETAEGDASDVAAAGSTEQSTDDSTAVEADEESATADATGSDVDATAGAESRRDGASPDPLAPDSVGGTETDPATGSSSPSATETESATPETHEPGDASVNTAGEAESVADDHGAESGHGHSHEGHDHGADVGTLGIAVVTVTSSRTRESDSSGDTIVEHVEAGDHEVVTREVIADDLDGVQRAVLSLTGRDDVDAVVTTGGTGVTPDDVTVEAVKPLFDKHLPGFGELFRILSYEEVGTRAISSRATAGISEGVPVFCLPGSVDAVRLAMAELVSEELAHLVGLATREE